MELYKIPVVSTIVYDSFSHEILVEKRKKPEYERGCYCFPGGKIRRNETIPGAARRELKEETDLINLHNLIKPEKFIGIIETRIYIVIFVLVTNFTNVLINKEPDKVEYYRWVPPKVLSSLKLTEGMESFITHLYDNFIKLI